MPIQVPTIKINPSVQPAQAPRLEAPQLDVASPMERQQNAIDRVGEQIIKFRNDEADRTADNTATNQMNRFLLWRKKYLYGDPGDPTNGVAPTDGMINKKGDPAKLYNDYLDAAQKQLNDLSGGKNEDGSSWSNETQLVVNRRLNKAVQQSRMEDLTQYSIMDKNYKDLTADTSVELSRQGMPFASSLIRPGDLSTFGQMNDRLTDIKNALISKHLTDGLAIKDAHGETPYIGSDGNLQRVTLAPAAQLDIAKKTSDALYDTIDNLLNTGDSKSLAIADAMKEQYADKLDKFHKDTLAKNREKAEQENRANDLVGQFEGKSDDQFEQALKGEDPVVVRKAREYRDANGRYMEDMRKRQQAANFRTLYNMTNDFKDKNPDATPDMVESQSWFKSLAKKISPTQLRSAKETVDPPTKTDPNAAARVQTALTGQDPDHDFSTMTPDERAQFMVGIGKDEEGRFLQRRALEAAMPSNAAQSHQYAQAMSQLKDQAFALRLVNASNDAGTDVAKGSADQQKLNALMLKFGKQVGPMLGKMSPGEVKQQAYDFVTNEIKTQNASKGSWFGSPEPTPTPTVTGTPPPTQLQIRGAAIREWRASHGSDPGEPELNNYIGSKPANYKWKIK